ncbi:MAG: FGGY family carbohydrate kinase, partial [Acidimicrobiia bacterium]
MIRTASDPIVIAIDAGTTGVRCAAVDTDGCIIAYRYREFTQYFPREGWVEHDADEIWEAVRSTLTQLCTALPRPIAAIGITNQRETIVAWDARSGRPRHRAIVWQDRRTAATCDRLRDEGYEQLVRTRTGLVLDPYFSATKAAWLLSDGGVTDDEHLRLGTIDTWLVWNLTGGRAHVTDVSNASRTSMYDIVNHRWDDELCELFAVPTRALPAVRPSSARLGVTVAGNGLRAGIPISGVAGDQQAALFGQACFIPGMAKNTYGTGSFLLLNAGTRCPSPTAGMLTTVAWQLGDDEPVYACEGAVFVTGAAIQWMRDQLGLITTSAEIGELAASVPDAGGMMLVPAFTGLGSPWWDPYARGTLVG